MMASELAVQFRKLLARLPLLMACWTSLIGASWVHDTLTPQRLPTTDIGQWIMYSRYYLGQSIPAYRVPLGVSPLLPFTLALATRVFGDSIQSAILVSSVLFFLLLMSVYLVVRELFHDSTCAVIAVLLVGFSEYLLVYLTAFGGLPQLAAIVSMNVGFVALAKIQRGVQGNASWILLSLSCLLVCFFHFPSAPLYLTTVAGSLAFLGCHRKAHARQLFLKACKYLLPPATAWSLYFLAFFHQLIEYARNSAGYYRSGVAALRDYLFMDGSFLAVVIMALSSMVFILLLAWRQNDRHIRGAAGLLLIWLLGPVTFMIVSHLLKVGTDYSRFLFYFVEPPLFALAYSLGILATWPFRQWSSFRSKPPRVSLIRLGSAWPWMIVLWISVVLGNSARFTMRFYPDAVDYFSIRDQSSFLEVVGRLESNRDAKTVLAPLVESMWIEGLSRRATIFSNKFRFLYRPGEIDRALAADLITTGSDTAVENGFVYLRFQPVPGGIPFNPDVAVYHRGEYVSILTFQDRLTTIDATIGGIRKRLNLGRDFERSLDAQLVNDGSRVEVTSHYSFNDPSSELMLTKSVVVSAESPEVEINIELTTDGNTNIESLTFQIADAVQPFREDNINGLTSSPLNQAHVTSVISKTNKVTIYHTEVDGSTIATDLTFSPVLSRWTLARRTPSRDKAHLELTYSVEKQSDVSLQVTVHPRVQERLRSGLSVHNMFDLLAHYNLGYLVLNRMNSHAQIVYDTLGFPRTYSNSSYVVYVVPGMRADASTSDSVRRSRNPW